MMDCETAMAEAGKALVSFFFFSGALSGLQLAVETSIHGPAI